MYEMDDDHIMTADEIDVLFYDKKSVNSINNEFAGKLSPRFIYGVNIEDTTSHKGYDILLELGKD